MMMSRSKAVVLWCAALALVACSCWASVQYPVVRSCQSEPSLVSIHNLSIEDAKVGRNMTIRYTGELHEVLQDAPITKFTMWNSNGMRMPCVQDMGSCTYKGCDGESAMERTVGEPWNNTCPIPPGVYSSKLVFFVHPLIKAVLGNGTFNVRMEVTSGDRKVQCRLLDVHIEK
ncbi:uncharacterized protein LOC119401627 [Rhipicephalus sanguineus]|uniref:uncharacterized protein LOC119401627 n=1 Tax=Rhipicephalus sanguineus TaxID=34632 RepID=UPI0018953F30|nr:uncharacterized protein LOC119401627 [Rhipicephalus sanguineus]